MKPLLRIKNIVSRYDDSSITPAVVDRLSFEVNFGEIGCLLGASGCGKTTILRAIAGFQRVESGEIELDGKLLCSKKLHLAPEKRQVGMVFQDYALFPHLSVCENVTFGLRKMSASAKESVCEDMLRLVKLEDFGQRFPHELSGGQQQRVALARALAPQPKLLLLDDPLSSLDPELRRSLALEVREILKSRNMSAIIVTHDQEEAFAFADKIGVLHKGVLEQWDVPFNLYHEPRTRYVANFVGQGVFIPGFLRENNCIETELGLLKSQRKFAWLENTPVDVLLRPDDIVEDSASPYKARVVHKVFAGTSTLYKLLLPTGSVVEAALTSHHNFDVGSEIGVNIDADHIIAFAQDFIGQPVS